MNTDKILGFLSSVLAIRLEPSSTSATHDAGSGHVGLQTLCSVEVSLDEFGIRSDENFDSVFVVRLL